MLEWLGKGGYKCTFCNLEFQPEPGSVTGTALPEARNHVASLHGMKHMRKAKMQWHGDPKSVEKNEIYKDKSTFWNQKAKDIDKIRSDAVNEDRMFTIESNVNENIAEAARTHADNAIVMEIVNPEGHDIDVEQVLANLGTEVQEGQVIILQHSEQMSQDSVQTEQVVEIDNVELVDNMDLN